MWEGVEVVCRMEAGSLGMQRLSGIPPVPAACVCHCLLSGHMMLSPQDRC